MTLLLPAHPGSASERADSTRSMLCMPIRAAHGIDATLNPKIVGVVQCINKLGDLHITNGAVDAPGFSTQVAHGLHPTSNIHHPFFSALSLSLSLCLLTCSLLSF